MSGGNPKTAAWYRTQYTDKSLKLTVLATDATAQLANVINPKSSKHTVFIQKIYISVTTDAAQSLTFQDGAGTPIVVGVSKASPGLGIHVVADHGAEGKALTEGEELDITATAGIAGQVMIEAYEKLTGTRSYLDGASVQ